VGKDGIGEDNADDPGHHIECGKSQPKNSQQPDVRLNASRAGRRDGNRPLYLFTATAAKALICFQLCSALIAKHLLALPNAYSEYDSADAFVPYSNEKATRQQGGLFFLRENSSNGDLNRQNFLAKSYEPQTGVSSNFLGNNVFVFRGLYIDYQTLGSASF
jgi:hypothetical protein